ncbi:RHS repeat-associated core domain-containing protein [Streptomyces sp. NPDC015140]|uniref:RHS repeat-associated core domain-containing protein n=1 Tax=unclassified Streptomyces TaxID=2593676 RepID=UPI0036F7E569
MPRLGHAELHGDRGEVPPTESVPQPYRYVGACADPTGLYKMGHRYYDPTLGRFQRPAPSGQEKNPYPYANGDPINNTYPDVRAPPRRGAHLVGAPGEAAGAGHHGGRPEARRAS